MQSSAEKNEPIAHFVEEFCSKAVERCSVLNSPSFFDNKKKKFGRLKLEEQSLLGGNL